MNFFLLKNKNPTFFSKPGGNILEVNTEYPVTNEFVRILKKKRIRNKEFLYFNMPHVNDDAETIKGWISSSEGILMSPEKFSEYTLKLRSKKFTSEQKQMVDAMMNNYSGDGDITINYRDIQFIPLKLANKKLQKKDLIFARLSFRNKTRKGYGDYSIDNYILWKETNEYKALNANTLDKIKTFDLDNDGIPEIYVEFEGRGEPSICDLFGYVNGNYLEIEFPAMTHYCSDIKIKSNGIIEIKENKKTLTYRYNKGKLIEVLHK